MLMSIFLETSWLSGVHWSSVAGLGALLGLVALASVVSRGARLPVGGATVGVVIVILGIVVAIGSGITFIEPDELGIVITAIGQGGIRPTPLEPGLHWVLPIAERVERYSILRQTYTMSSSPNEGQVVGDDAIQVRTKDGQQVSVDASVIYAVDKVRAVDLYTTWRGRYQDDLVRPQARGIIRDVASQYGVEEIVSSKRAEMEQTITDELKKIFTANHLILEDFVLRDIQFSAEYANAVEQKQISEQQAQQAKFIVEQKRQEAEQARQVAQGQADAAVIAAKGAADARIIQAKAEAEALRLIGESLRNNPDLLSYRYIEKLAPNVEVMYLPSGGSYLVPLPTPPTPTVLPEPTVTP